MPLPTRNFDGEMKLEGIKTNWEHALCISSFVYFPNTDGESKYTDNAKYSNQMVCIFSSIITCASNVIGIIFVWKMRYIHNIVMS